MQTLQAFFENPGNQQALAFLHGLAYFVMGLTVLLAAGRRRHAAGWEKAAFLSWMALFGLTHALALWWTSAAAVRAPQLSGSAARLSEWLGTGLTAFAAAVFAHFSWSLSSGANGHEQPADLLGKAVPLAVLSWIFVSAGYRHFIPQPFWEKAAGMLSVLMPYGVYLAAAAWAAAALSARLRQEGAGFGRRPRWAMRARQLRASLLLFAVSAFLMASSRLTAAFAGALTPPLTATGADFAGILAGLGMAAHGPHWQAFETAGPGAGLSSGNMRLERKTPHKALRSMRRRAALLGGTLDVRSARGSGTEIILIVPDEAVERRTSPARGRISPS